MILTSRIESEMDNIMGRNSNRLWEREFQIMTLNDGEVGGMFAQQRETSSKRNGR